MCYLGDLETRDTVRLANLNYRLSDTRFVSESDGFEKNNPPSEDLFF